MARLQERVRKKGQGLRENEEGNSDEIEEEHE